MDIYHHLENTKVFIRPTSGTAIHELDLLSSGATFSQTFTENTYGEKTLQNSGHLVKKGNFIKANPANFSFAIPLLKEDDFSASVFDLIVSLDSTNNLQSFDLFFVDQDKSFFINSCVFTSCSFSIQQGSLLSLELSGQGIKIEESGGTGSPIITDSTWSISGVAANFSSSNIVARTSPRQLLPLTKVLVGRTSGWTTESGVVTSTSNATRLLLQTSMELQNNMIWLPYDSIHKGVEGEIMYPSAYTLEGRILAGNAKWAMTSALNATEQLTARTNNTKFYENSAWTTGALSLVSGTDYGIKFNAASGVNISSRISPGAIYTLDMDWRLASNSSDISSLLTYITA